MSDQPEKIAQLNDKFRKSIFDQPDGRVLVTRSLRDAFNDDAIVQILTKVKNFDQFDSGNNPYGTKDFGSFNHDDERILWKFDYYDQDTEYGSPDPANQEITNRVLTVMLSCDW